MDDFGQMGPNVDLCQIVKSVPGCLYQLALVGDRRLAFTYLSPQAIEMFGTATEDLLRDSDRFWSRLSATDTERFHDLLLISARDMSPFQLTFSLRVGSQMRWLACQGLPFQDVDGQVRWTGHFLDCSQRQDADQKLLRSETLLKAAQVQAKLGVWDFDLESGKITWSAEVFEIHGVDPAQGEPDMEGLAKLYLPEDFKILARGVDRAITTGEGYRFELRIVRPGTNEIRHVTANGGVLKNPNTGVPELLYGTIFDITAHKQLEESLSAARDAAESSAIAKANFLASMSHELRTPLNGIVGMTSLLRRSPLDKTQHNYCETIHHSAEALIAVVNDILDWSRIESGKIQLESIEFQFPDLVAMIIEILRPQADAKKLALDLQHPTRELPTLKGDPTRLRQVLLNLGANAIKFTESGYVRFEFGQVCRTANEVSLRLNVIDSGIGITPAQMQRLFQRFSQADASTTRRFGGTGLGLAISKSLIELMGGQIGVESEPGHGSTFWIEITLPVVETAPKPVKEKPAAKAVSSHRPIHILIAEDNEVNQQLATLVLSQAGHTLEIAPNGLHALHKTLSSEFDLILMDCQMPEMDGFEATRKIREQCGRSIPIIGLTASALIDDRQNCLAAGMDDYLTKPYRAEQLIQIVQKWAAADASQMAGAKI